MFGALFLFQQPFYRQQLHASAILLAQPEELLRAGDGIGHGVLAVNDNGRWKIGFPDRWRNKVRRGLQCETGGIGRPRQITLCSKKFIVSGAAVAKD